MATTFENFFKDTFVVFKGCKRPKRNPDYISYIKDLNYSLYVDIDTVRKYILRVEGAYNNCIIINNSGIKAIEKQYNCKCIDSNNNELLLYEIGGKAKTTVYLVSSSYWYGEDSKGKYVIRSSNHWSAKNSLIDCKNVASCIWNLFVPKQTNALQNNKESCGKAYLSWFKERK